MFRRKTKLPFSRAAAAVVVVAAMGLGACGSSEGSDGGDGGTAGASAGAGPKPMEIGYVDQSLAVGTQRMWYTWFSSAAETFGWDVSLYDANGVAADVPRGIMNFVNKKVDAIVVGCIGGNAYAQAAKAAKTAKIPIMEIGCLDSEGGVHLDAWYGEPEVQLATVLAEKITTDLKSGDQIAMIGYDGLEATRVRADILTKSFKDAGVDMVEYVQPSNIMDPQEPGRLASSLMTKYPELDAIVLNAPFFAASVVSTIQQTGKDVPVYGVNLDSTQLPLLKKGSPLVGVVDGAVAVLTFKAAEDLLAYFEKGTKLTHKDDVEVPDVKVFSQEDRPEMTNDYLGVVDIKDYLPDFIEDMNTKYGYELEPKYASATD